MADQDSGDVRLLLGDLSEDGDTIFTDDQIVSFLRMSKNSVKRAAARGLLVIAGSEVMLSKKIRTQDLSTDGPAVAAELRAQAKDLVAEADAEEKQDDVVDAYADYIPLDAPTRMEAEEYRCL